MLENNKNPRPASGRCKRGQTYENYLKQSGKHRTIMRITFAMTKTNKQVIRIK